MESVLGIIFSAENIRMLVLLAFGFSGFIWINMNFERRLFKLDKKIDGVKTELLTAMDEKIDSKLNTFHTQLKTNDFAHLNSTIEALTFTLEKNGFLKTEDKAYIDGRLDK